MCCQCDAIVWPVFFSETIDLGRYIGQNLASCFENLSDVIKDNRFYQHRSAATHTAKNSLAAKTAPL